LGIATHRIGQRALVLADHQIGRVGRRHRRVVARRAQESPVGEQEASVAVGHRQPERQAREQCLDLGQPRPRVAQRGLVVEDQEQRRRLRRVGRPAQIGIGNRQVNEAQGHALGPFARVKNALALVGAEPRDEITARDLRALARSTGSEGRIGDPHMAIGQDNGGLHALAREGAAQFSADMGGHVGQKIGLCQRHQPPDQMILAPPGPRDGERPAPLGRGNLRQSGLPIAPCGPRRSLDRLAMGASSGRRGGAPWPNHWVKRLLAQTSRPARSTMAKASSGRSIAANVTDQSGAASSASA
jgi:hypothetical protein